MHKPQPIKVHTCDQCGKDIGKPDGYGSNYPYFEITAKDRQPVCADDDAMTTYSMCSPQCLTVMAGRVAAGERIQVSD